MNKPYFKIQPHGSGGFYWVLHGGNGEPICHSEAYTTLPSARQSVGRMKLLVANATVQFVPATLLTPVAELKIIYPFKMVG